MLKKIVIQNEHQFQNIVERASKIVIYGAKKFGRLLADYLLDSGKSEKLIGIIQTSHTLGCGTSYRGVTICTANEFFQSNAQRSALVIIAVGNLEYRDEILVTLEELNISSCAIFPGMRIRMLYMLAENTGNDDVVESGEDRLCIFTEGQLCELAEDAQQIFIYGTKTNAKIVADYLKIPGYDRKIRRIVAVSKEESAGSYKVTEDNDYIFEHEKGKKLILVANDVLTYGYKPCCDIEGISERSSVFCTAELIDRLTQHMATAGKNTSRQDVKFIVAGFPKCGTTSLHYALQTVDDVFLPDCKETEYFWYKNSIVNSREKLVRRFYSDVPEGHIVGCVEPSFYTYARQVYDDFGPDIKLCFAIRNPVDATFSLFKMMNRYGDFSFYDIYDLYEKYGSYCSEMFDDFCDQIEKTKYFCFDYAAILSDFRQYYPSEQIKIICFEELIRYPEDTINDLLCYIGSQRKYDPQNKFPRENASDFVWEDKTGCLLGMKSFMLFDEKKECLSWRIQDDSIAALHRANEIENRMLRLSVNCETAKKIYRPKMKPEQHQRLEDFFRPSVRRLEKMLGRDLSELWFE